VGNGRGWGGRGKRGQSAEVRGEEMRGGGLVGGSEREGGGGAEEVGVKRKEGSARGRDKLLLVPANGCSDGFLSTPPKEYRQIRRSKIQPDHGIAIRF